MDVTRPDKTTFAKDNIMYDLKCRPFDYFLPMIRMMKYIESKDQTILNTFPLKTSIVPGSIKVDTELLINYFFTKEHGKKKDYRGSDNKDDLWDIFFKMDHRIFRKKNYKFHYMIDTDGISCSLLFNHKVSADDLSLTTKETYLDSLTKKDLIPLKDKKVVGIDPGINNLLMCVDGTNKNTKKLRYTQTQRRRESYTSIYRKIVIKQKNKTYFDDKNVTVLETELSNYNKKTLKIDDFKEYIKNKCEFYNTATDFYEKKLFRKMRLNGYIKRKTSEQNFMNRFTEKFGKSSDTVICIGDFVQRSHMKYKEPVKGKGFRSMFRKSGYKLYLIDEFRTSCMCCKCEKGRCDNTVTRNDPRPWNKGNTQKIHELLRCTNDKCRSFWNRDINGSTNILKLAKAIINGEDRPQYLSRSNNFQG